MKPDSSLRFAAIAGLVVALLIGLVALVVRPSLSTLDGRAVYNCHLAPHGARVSIEFAEVPTAMGKADVLEIAASIPEGRLCTFQSARAVT
jgi:hypothetical protein